MVESVVCAACLMEYDERATLNFIDLCGVHTAFFDADFENETLIKAIGFEKNPAGRWEMDLTDFFREPCKHSKKAL